MITALEMDAISRGLGPVVRELIAEERAAYQKQISALELRILELETRPMIIGPQGERGQDGKDAELPEFSICKESGALEVKIRTGHNQFKIVSLGFVVGARGLDGMHGPAGKDGERGEPGPQGLMGPAGPPGPMGEKGLQGERGERGEMGPIGEKGLQGDRGNDGPVGVGIAGRDGRDGQSGLDGAPGAKGLDGKDGRDGLDGKDGAPGLNGKDGAHGINGKDGLNGISFDEWDFYVDAARGVVLRLASGSRVKELVAPMPFYLPDWAPGLVAPKGGSVQWDGGYWLALKETTTSPKEGLADWQLLVRRGKQGSQGPKGADGKDAPKPPTQTWG